MNVLHPARAIDNRPYDRERTWYVFAGDYLSSDCFPPDTAQPVPTKWWPVFGAFVGGGVPDAPNRSRMLQKVSRERTVFPVCHCELSAHTGCGNPFPLPQYELAGDYLSSDCFPPGCRGRHPLRDGDPFSVRS